MYRSIAVIALASLLAPLAAQQDKDAEAYKIFRTGIEKRLKAHPFFSRITFTIVDRPPFLFCVERPAVDEPKYELGVANSYLPHLRELLKQFEANYVKPGKLWRRPEAGGYALAVLASAGRYVDFRTAIGDPSLAMARAHYTPELRLAVTYQDAFARHNTKSEERHALLHEFVHALQHAYSANGEMPKPVWFNEGLADYRSSCTNSQSSLAEPPLQGNHIAAMAFGYGNPAGRFYVSPLKDLVAAVSYGDVVKQAKRRNKAEVPAETLLSMFYAQSEMFVRFLHEGEKGKYRDGFLRYVAAAQGGASGAAAFQKALAVNGDAISKMETEWLTWLTGILKKRYPRIPNLANKAAAGGGGEALAAPMSPPIAFDTSKLHWSAKDLADRFEGARRLCADGSYDAGLKMLPADGEVPAEQLPFLKRERKRIAELVRVRDMALKDLLKRKGRLSMVIDGDRIAGNVQRREGDNLVVKIKGKEQVFPLTVMGPLVLKSQAKRFDLLKGKGRWFEVWARWLNGESCKRLKGLLKLEYSTMKELRGDLTYDLDGDRGRAAAALVTMLNLPQTNDREQALEALATMRQLVRAHGESGLLQRRKVAIRKLARAYAERAFRIEEPSALGLSGTVERSAKGMMTASYTKSSVAPRADFAPLTKQQLEQLPIEQTKTTYSGRSGLTAKDGIYQLVGSKWLRWAVPLRGRHSVELKFAVSGDFVPDFGIGIGVGPGRMMIVYPTGSVQVMDLQQRVMDTVGGGGQLMVDKVHTLRIEHDGKKRMTVSLDGQQTARVGNVGRMVGGDVYLYVSSSNPIKVSGIKISGTPNPGNPQEYRDRYVTSIVRGLWQ